MSRMCKTASVLFFVMASVYPGGSMSAAAERRANPSGSGGDARTTDVRLLDETSGPIAAANGAAAAVPTPAAAPTTKPASGQSIDAQQVSVSDAGTVEIHVSDTDLVAVLRMLSLRSQKNIIASKEVRGTITANLYNVTIREALDAILKGNGYAYREKGNFIFVYSEKELKEIEKSERQMATEVFRLYYTPAANVVNIIKPALSAEGQVSFTAAAQMGIDSNPKEAGGNAYAGEDLLVIRDYADNMEKIKKIIKEVDKRPQQVLVEATIIAARLSEDNSLGIDFTMVGGVDFSSFTSAGGLFNGLTLPKDGAGGIDKTSRGTLSNAGSGTTFSKMQNPGFKVGVVTNNLAIFLNALESTTDTAILANPKILTLNKQRGEVLVGREDGYKTTTVTESTTVQTVEFLKTGTRLIFRPYIGEDGYIRMEIHPEDSAGGVKNDLPSKSTTEVTTNVLVKDGHTIVIGGLFRENSQVDRSQVPGLGSIPGLGMLFRNQADTTDREEVIILLTPHIVKDELAYAKASEQELKEIEKLRVGVRRGMMFWGRERLAETSYQWAVDEMKKPTADRKKALWYLDCATNLNPKFLEAIKMKENLTGRELSTVDNSSIRGFVRRQILAERSAAVAAEAFSPASPVTPVRPAAEVARTPAVPANEIVADVAADEMDGVDVGECEETDVFDLETEAAVEGGGGQPATSEQPAAEAGTTTGAIAEPLLEKSESVAAMVAASEASTAAPATQPTHAEEGGQTITVTELPSEPVGEPEAGIDADQD